MEVSNIRPVAILSSYLCVASLLTAKILRNLYQKSNRPQAHGQGPRYGTPPWKHLVIFATLAAVSLAITWYYMLAFFILSYQTWARNAGVVLPTRLWGSGGFLAGGKDAVRLHLGAWLKDTTLFRDAWETVVDGSTRFWWSQQIFLITTAWSVYLGVEGNRRKIPHLWMFMLLGQIVAISFAANLSFLALLLWDTESRKDVAIPGSQPGRTMILDKSVNGVTSGLSRSSEHQEARYYENANHSSAQKNSTDHNSYYLYIASLGLTFTSIYFIPSAVNTGYFLYPLLVPHVLLFIPVQIPSGWNQIQFRAASGLRAPLAAVGAYRLVADLSILLYARSTISALTDVQFGGVQSIINELHGHPAVSSVSWDVTICLLSASLWALLDAPRSWGTLKHILPIVRHFYHDPAPPKIE